MNMYMYVVPFSFVTMPSAPSLLPSQHQKNRHPSFAAEVRIFVRKISSFSYRLFIFARCSLSSICTYSFLSFSPLLGLMRVSEREDCQNRPAIGNNKINRQMSDGQCRREFPVEKKSLVVGNERSSAFQLSRTINWRLSLECL